MRFSQYLKMTPGNHNLPVIWPHRLNKGSGVFAFGCIKLYPRSSAVACCPEAVMDSKDIISEKCLVSPPKVIC